MTTQCSETFCLRSQSRAWVAAIIAAAAAQLQQPVWRGSEGEVWPAP